MKSSALRWANSLVEGDHDQLLDPEALDHVALDREGHDQLRQRRRVQDLERVRLEGEHRVGALDHRLVAEVDAVEGADRDLARARLGVAQRGDLDRSSAPQRVADRRDQLGDRGRPASSLAGVLDPERADRGAAQVRAVGVAEGLDQGADVGAGGALDLVVGELAVAGRAARPGGPRRRASGVSTTSPRWAFL